MDQTVEHPDDAPASPLPAGWVVRIAAGIADWAAIQLVFFGLVMADIRSFAPLGWVLLSLVFAYMSAFQGSTGQTPGNAFAGIYAGRSDGRPIGVPGAMLRTALFHAPVVALLLAVRYSDGWAVIYGALVALVIVAVCNLLSLARGGRVLHDWGSGSSMLVVDGNDHPRSPLSTLLLSGVLLMLSLGLCLVAAAVLGIRDAFLHPRRWC